MTFTTLKSLLNGFKGTVLNLDKQYSVCIYLCGKISNFEKNGIPFLQIRFCEKVNLHHATRTTVSDKPCVVTDYDSYLTTAFSEEMPRRFLALIQNYRNHSFTRNKRMGDKS